MSIRQCTSLSSSEGQLLSCRNLCDADQPHQPRVIYPATAASYPLLNRHLHSSNYPLPVYSQIKGEKPHTIRHGIVLIKALCPPNSWRNYLPMTSVCMGSEIYEDTKFTDKVYFYITPATYNVLFTSFCHLHLSLGSNCVLSESSLHVTIHYW